MKCIFCNRDVREQPLFRINPRGEKGKFACEICCIENGINLDDSLVKDTNTIHEFGNKTIKN